MSEAIQPNTVTNMLTLGGCGIFFVVVLLFGNQLLPPSFMLSIVIMRLVFGTVGLRLLILALSWFWAGKSRMSPTNTYPHSEAGLPPTKSGRDHCAIPLIDNRGFGRSRLPKLFILDYDDATPNYLWRDEPGARVSSVASRRRTMFEIDCSDQKP